MLKEWSTLTKSILEERNIDDIEHLLFQVAARDCARNRLCHNAFQRRARRVTDLPICYPIMKIVAGSDGTPLNVLEFEAYAKEYLPKNAYDYYASGADEMFSLRDNRDAFKRLTLRPRVLRDVSNMDISTTVLGERITTPVCVAPTAMQRMAHPEGELASTAAASKTGNCFILSSLSTTSLEVRGERWSCGLLCYS